MIKILPYILCLFIANILVADVALDIEQKVRENITAVAAENEAAMLSTIHPDSLSYAQTKQIVGKMFQSYDLKYTLISFRYIGMDGEYALVRMLQRTEKITGPEFKDNDVDMIQIYKQHKGVWKLWSQAILAIKPVPR